MFNSHFDPPTREHYTQPYPYNTYAQHVATGGQPPPPYILGLYESAAELAARLPLPILWWADLLCPDTDAGEPDPAFDAFNAFNYGDDTSPINDFCCATGSTAPTDAFTPIARPPAHEHEQENARPTPRSPAVLAQQPENQAYSALPQDITPSSLHNYELSPCARAASTDSVPRAFRAPHTDIPDAIRDTGPDARSSGIFLAPPPDTRSRNPSPTRAAGRAMN